MNKTVKKIWNIFTTILVVLVVLLAVLLVGARLVGLQVFTVLSGSMEPTYHTGALIYVKKVDTQKIQVGTPITFMMDEDTVATHRVVDVVPDEQRGDRPVEMIEDARHADGAPVAVVGAELEANAVAVGKCGFGTGKEAACEDQNDQQDTSGQYSVVHGVLEPPIQKNMFNTYYSRRQTRKAKRGFAQKRAGKAIFGSLAEKSRPARRGRAYFARYFRNCGSHASFAANISSTIERISRGLSTAEVSGSKRIA